MAAPPPPAAADPAPALPAPQPSPEPARPSSQDDDGRHAARISAEHAGRAVTAAWAGVVVNAVIVVVALFTPVYQQRQDRIRRAEEAVAFKQVAVTLGTSIVDDVAAAVKARRTHVQSWLKLIRANVPPEDDSAMQRCVEHTDALYARGSDDPKLALLLQYEGDVCKAASQYLRRSYVSDGSRSPIASIESDLVVMTDTADADRVLKKVTQLSNILKTNVAADGTVLAGRVELVPASRP